MADDLAKRGTLLVPSAIPCSLSHLSYPLFSDWRRTVSSKFFDTQVPSISFEELVLPRHARCVLSRICCNGRSLLLSSYLSRIENPSCSACGHPSQYTCHVIPHCLATDSASLALWQLSVPLRLLMQALWSCSASGAPCSSALLQSLGRGWVATTTVAINNFKTTF